MNPAEFLADLISIDYSSAESVHYTQKRIDDLVEAFSKNTSNILYATPITKSDAVKISTKFVRKPIVKRKGGWWRQFWLLLKRAWMQVIVLPIISFSPISSLFLFNEICFLSL